MNLKKQVEKYLRVNLLGPGPRLMKKRIYRAAVSQRLRNTALNYGQEIKLLPYRNSTSSHLTHRFSVLKVTLEHCAGIIYEICTEDSSVEACQPK